MQFSARQNKERRHECHDKICAGRRDFLKQSGAIVVGFSLASAAAFGQQASPLPGSLNTNRMLDGWLRINADGTVTVFTGKVELGQGIVTALAQIAADELDVAYERIEMIPTDTARSPNEGMTAGSQSVEYSGTALHYAAAEARDILLQLAATRLGVATDKLTVTDGTVSAGAAKTTYWELAQNANFKREAGARVKPKPPARHQVIGKPIPRRDIPKKVTGGAAYVQDMRLPGMVFGRVVRPPSRRAELESCDEAAVRKLPGVVAVVRDGNFLAVAAEREEQAIKAAQALRANSKWKESPDLPPHGMAFYEHLQKLPSRDSVVNSKVRATAAGGQVNTLESTYTRPFQCHASIGPSCAVAQLKDGQIHGVDAQPGRVSAAPAPRARIARARNRTSPRSMSKAPAATARTAPTMSRAMPRWSRARPAAGRSSCNGCAKTNSAGSLMARRW